MPTHSLKARALILCLALFIPGTALVHAGGRAETRTADVERLIQQKDYSSALKLLAAIQRNDPNMRDKTDRLVAQIMAVSQQFNAVLEKLNQAIADGDVEKTAALVAELQNIDPARAGVFGPLQLRFLRLMNSAQALLHDDKPADALSTYLLPFVDPAKAGFTLPLAQFEAAGHGDLITAGVKKARGDVVATAQQELKAAPDISRVLSDLKALVNQPPPVDPTTESSVAASRFDGITEPLLRAAAAEASVRSWAAFLADMNRPRQGDAGKGSPDPYIRYLVWLWLGRDNVRDKTPEGMAYALHLLWSEPAQSAADAATESLTAAFESARARYLSGAYDDADAALRDMPTRSLIAVKSAALAVAQYGAGAANGWKIPDAESAAARTQIGRALGAQELSAEAAGYRLLISYRKDLVAMPAVPAGPVTATSPRPSGGGGFIPSAAESPARQAAVLVAARAALTARAAEVRSQDSKWTAIGASWESKAAVVESVSALADSARRLAALFRQFADEDIKAADLAYAIRIAALGGVDYPDRLDSAVVLRKKAEDLNPAPAPGVVPPGVVPPGTAPALKHPYQALEALSSAGGILDSLVTDIQAQGSQLAADTEYVKTSPAIIALFDGTPGKPGYNAILQSALAEKATIDSLAAAAQTSVDNAAVASREGDNSYAQALAALNEGDPVRAADALDQATKAYLKSLAEAYTDHAADRSTKGVDEINKGIDRLQNKTAVANAQKATVVINNFIAGQDYLGASDALDAAVRAWNLSQDSTYPPFDDLRKTIQAARDLGQQLNRLDPKADVVGAFIKNAKDNLVAGRLADAAQNVKDALSLAPNFSAAKVLELTIRKQTDPIGFQKDAASQIQAYLATANGTNQDGWLTAYRALRDYSQLDPKFEAQLRVPIQNLSYKLGLATPPPTPQQIAQANSLVQQADALQQQGSADAYRGALRVLREAQAIIPQYPSAVRLFGIISEKMGNLPPSALSDADTTAYNLAYSLFLSGAYQDAYDKVMTIWPSNKNYGPLLRLKKRLEVQLNIS